MRGSHYLMSNLNLYIITVLIWGSTWLAIEFQISTVSAEVSIFYRYALATLLLFLWSKYRRLRLKFNWRAHAQFVLLGLFMFSLNYIFAYHAQGHITSAVMAIVFSSMLVMNILHTRLFFGIKSGINVLLGALIGMFGLILVLSQEVENFSFNDKTLLGIGFGVVGTYLASLGNIISQYAQKKSLPIVQTNAWGMFYGTILTGLIALSLGREFVINTSFSYASSLLYLAVFGSVIGFWSYLTLLGRVGANRAGYATILFPLVAVLLSFFFEGFVIEVETFVGIILVLLGNYLVMSKRLGKVRHQTKVCAGAC